MGYRKKVKNAVKLHEAHSHGSDPDKSEIILNYKMSLFLVVAIYETQSQLGVERAFNG